MLNYFAQHAPNSFLSAWNDMDSNLGLQGTASPSLWLFLRPHLQPPLPSCRLPDFWAHQLLAALPPHCACSYFTAFGMFLFQSLQVTFSFCHLSLSLIALPTKVIPDTGLKEAAGNITSPILSFTGLVLYVPMYVMWLAALRTQGPAFSSSIKNKCSASKTVSGMW